MKRIELLFNTLIEAFDEFFRIEEKFVGCLTDEEHKELMKMRNRIDEIFMQKLNPQSHEEEEKEEQASLMYLPCLDDEDAIEAHKKKRLQEMEL